MRVYISAFFTSYFILGKSTNLFLSLSLCSHLGNGDNKLIWSELREMITKVINIYDNASHLADSI